MATTTAAEPKLRLRDLDKRFGAKQVLQGVNLDVAPGASMVIVGPSGCGKSVTIKCALGLLEPDCGDVLLDGASVTGGRAETLRARSGMLFQGAALFDSLPVWRNIAFRLLHSGMPKREARAIAVDRLARVGLPEATATLMPAELSGGMQKRVGLARAIAADPEILFFDEPTTGLDPIAANTVSHLIRNLVSDAGVTAITITHDLDSARIIGDRFAMLHGGVLQWEGSASELEQSGNPFVEQFIAGSATGPIPTLR